MIAILLAAALAGPNEAPAEPGHLECNVGSTVERIGGNDWIVHGCADGQSVVVVAGPPNPASPFYFFLMPNADGIVLHGEGTGEKSATAPAYEQLKAMSAEDLACLYRKAADESAR
jgi:hypothetical protein